jgi:alkylhydroperoxidase family enzyme
MSFLKTVDPSEAGGPLSEQYEAEISSKGYLPNYVQTFSLRPEVYDAWGALISAVKSNMDPRRYELATLAAARELRSSYCALAHGKVLLDRFLDEETLRDLVVRPAPDEIDRQVMLLAGKAAGDATTVTELDIEDARRAGLTDEEIFDVILTAAGRAFFTKVIDGTGTSPDPEYRSLLGEDMVNLLAVGRPVATTGGTGA